MNNLIVRVRTTLFLLLIAFCAVIIPSWYLPTLFFCAMCWTLFYEWPQFCAHEQWIIFLTPFYPVVPYALLILMSSMTHGVLVVGFLFFIVGLFDSGSYFCGNLFGRTLLCPEISPKKTVEGVLGGAVCAIIGACVIYRFLYTIFPLSFPLYLVHVTMLCVSALFGDLFESWLKRRARLKDAGDILPGHGGFLDRLDGVFGAVLYLMLISTF